MERHAATIETEWKELRAVLQDQMQSLVTEIEAGNAWGVMERLGDTMYTMCAARETDEQDSEEVAVLSMWDEIVFHAVRVGVTFEGGVEEETVADTGAAPLLQ